MKVQRVTPSITYSTTDALPVAAFSASKFLDITHRLIPVALLAVIVASSLCLIPLAQAQTLTVLHNFAGIPDGSQPHSALVRDSSGNLYGTTFAGGIDNEGTVFKTTSTGTTTILHSFTGGTTDGEQPYAGLVMDSSGNLYGTTYAGGASSLGTVFKTTSAGTTTILHSFAGGSSDGANPYAGLVLDSSGNLYGTTFAGGTSNLGTVFKTTSTGVTTIFHSFTGTVSDGSSPYGGLARDSSGNLYGTTYLGGSSNLGVLFKTTSTGTTTVVFSFIGGPGGGANPRGGLIIDASGNLYGTTYAGGASGLGTVFKVTSATTQVVLYSFLGGSSDGSHPYAGVVRDSSGNLYGTTFSGGTSGNGTAFEITSTSIYSLLLNFSSHGTNPEGALILDSSGNLYGTTLNGGTSLHGEVFKLVP